MISQFSIMYKVHVLFMNSDLFYIMYSYLHSRFKSKQVVHDKLLSIK